MPALSPAEVITSPFVDVERVGVDLDRREAPGQLPRPGPVGGGAATVEQAGVGEREGAGADREHAGAAAAGGAQGGQGLRGRRLEQGGVAGDDDRVGPAQGAEPGLRADPEAAGGADLGPADRAGREPVQRLAARPGRQPERLRRRRQVEGDESVEAERDHAVHGRNLADIGIPASGEIAAAGARIGGMEIAILIFDKLAALDAVGPTK